MGNFGRIQFLSKSCCEQTHWFERPIANVAMQGDIQAEETPNFGMFRTPFSCGYYKYTENIHLVSVMVSVFLCLVWHFISDFPINYLYFILSLRKGSRSSSRL